MISPFSWDWFKICSLMPNLKIKSHQTLPKSVKRQPKTTWVWFQKKVSSKNVSISKTFWMSDIAVSSLARQVAVRQQSGKHCFNHWRDSAKMVRLIPWIQKPSMSMNCSVITQNQKNGETVCCQWSWRIRTSASKSTRRLTFTSGQFWTVMWIRFGLSHWTLWWMTIRCWRWFQMTEFPSLLQWDYCSRFRTWKTPVQPQFQEAVCFSSTNLISDGAHSSTVGSTVHNRTWSLNNNPWQ